jgi:hypothetical protein
LDDGSDRFEFRFIGNFDLHKRYFGVISISIDEGEDIDFVFIQKIFEGDTLYIFREDFSFIDVQRKILDKLLFKQFAVDFTR